MGYHLPRQTNPYPQSNVQGGQPQNTGYNNQTSRSQSQQPSIQTGSNPTMNRSLSASRPPVSGQAQPFGAYGTGQNSEPGLQYVPPTNTPQYMGAQGQIQSPSYQDPNQAYQSTEPYFPLESQSPHLVPQQNRTHHSPPQQPSVPHNPTHSVQGQYPQYQRGDEYSAGHPQQQRSSSAQYPQQQQQQQQQHQRRPSSSQYPQQQQQRPPSSQYPQQQQQNQQNQQPSAQFYSPPPQSSAPQYQQQQSPTQSYPQHQQSSAPQQRRPSQPSTQTYAQQQQSQPLRQQGNFATAPGNTASSFGQNVAGQSYGTPGEQIRQSRSMHRGTSGDSAQSRSLAAHAGPLCRLLNCRNAAIRDGATQELTEYCSQDHMQEDTLRGAPLCPACNKCPRRINGRYCGSSCEKYDRERLQQPHQQQQHYSRPPAGVKPHLSAPSPSGNVNWGPGEVSPVGNFAPDNQHIPGGLVRCPKCNTTYSARGRSHSRYGGQGGPVESLPPPCPMCGFSR